MLILAVITCSIDLWSSAIVSTLGQAILFTSLGRLNSRLPQGYHFLREGKKEQT